MNSHEAAARKDRVARIVRFLDGLHETPHQLLARIDDDRTWFKAWVASLGFWARCPSSETRATVRETIRARLPELELLTPEMRDQLEQLERARDAAGWCAVCEGTGIETDDDGQWPCTESKHEVES